MDTTKGGIKKFQFILNERYKKRQVWCSFNSRNVIKIKKKNLKQHITLFLLKQLYNSDAYLSAVFNYMYYKKKKYFLMNDANISFCLCTGNELNIMINGWQPNPGIQPRTFSFSVGFSSN